MASNAFLARAYGRAVAALGLERKLPRPELVAPVAFERVNKCRVIKNLVVLLLLRHVSIDPMKTVLPGVFPAKRVTSRTQNDVSRKTLVALLTRCVFIDPSSGLPSAFTSKTRQGL